MAGAVARRRRLVQYVRMDSESLNPVAQHINFGSGPPGPPLVVVAAQPVSAAGYAASQGILARNAGGTVMGTVLGGDAVLGPLVMIVGGDAAASIRKKITPFIAVSTLPWWLSLLGYARISTRTDGALCRCDAYEGASAGPGRIDTAACEAVWGVHIIDDGWGGLTDVCGMASACTDACRRSAWQRCTQYTNQTAVQSCCAPEAQTFCSILVSEQARWVRPRPRPGQAWPGLLSRRMHAHPAPLSIFAFDLIFTGFCSGGTAYLLRSTFWWVTAGDAAFAAAFLFVQEMYVQAVRSRLAGESPQELAQRAFHRFSPAKLLLVALLAVMVASGVGAGVLTMSSSLNVCGDRPFDLYCDAELVSGAKVRHNLRAGSADHAMNQNQIRSALHRPAP